MAEIHNSKQRMPLILNQNEEATWLNGLVQPETFADRSKLALVAWEIDKKTVLGKNANVQTINQPFSNRFEEQLGLFD